MLYKILGIVRTLFLFLLFLQPIIVDHQVLQADTHIELTDKVDELFNEWDGIDSPGAVVGIFKNGKILYARGYGMANLDYNIPISPQTVFRVGSVSKQFTAMCIALLVEQGRISLDDDIRKYLPSMHKFDLPVTIRHLIHHTSGIRDYLVLQGLAGRSDGYFYTSEEVVDLLSRQRELNFKPGSKYSYSNSGYFLLAEIVGRVSGMKASDYARKFIFEPLGMENTHFHDNPKMVVKNRASGYMPLDGNGFKIHMTQLNMIGDGGIFTSVEDFFKWDQNFYSNKLGQGTPDLINMVLTPGKLEDGREIEYAFGLVVSHYRGLRTISHGGSFVGFKAQYLQFPEQRFSVVILSNLGSFNPGRIARSIADLYLADFFTEPPESQRESIYHYEEPSPIRFPKEQLEKFVGVYYSDELDATASLQTDPNNLVIKLGRYKGSLTPISSDTFLGKYLNDDAYDLENRKIKFIKDQEKRITGFVMETEEIKNLKFKKIK
jgi:CubicO group peptidase (beta-lactamase class C family)